MAKTIEKTVSYSSASASGIVALVSGVLATASTPSTLLVNQMDPNDGDLERQIVLKFGDCSLTGTGSASTDIWVSGVLANGESTTWSTGVGGTTTTLPIGPFMASISGFRSTRSTITGGELKVGWASIVRTGWIPVDHHAGGVVRVAVHADGSGSARTDIHHTYTNLLDSTKASGAFAFNSGVGTIEGAEGATTFNYPIGGVRFQVEGTGEDNINLFIYQTEFSGD